MMKKKISKDWILGAYTKDNEKARGILIGNAKAGESHYQPVVFLMSDNDGKTFLVINEDKVAEMGGEIIVKKYDEPFLPLGFWDDEQGGTK